jgi:hypothetical protein
VPREKEERVNIRLVMTGDFDLVKNQELPAAMTCAGRQLDNPLISMQMVDLVRVIYKSIKLRILEPAACNSNSFL